MKRTTARPGAILLLVALLQACDGDSGGGSSARLTVGSTNLTVSATPGDATPQQTVTVSIANPTADRVFLQVTHTGEGIDVIDVVQPDPAQGSFEVRFVSTGSLLNGGYDATITVRACTDSQCSSEINGSPATVASHYEISGTGASIASLDRDSVEHLTYHDVSHEEVVPLATLTLAPRPASSFTLRADSDSNAILTVSHQDLDDTHSDLFVVFRAAEELDVGIYRDPIMLSVCYDDSCVRQVEGSPFTIATKLTVDSSTERGMGPLEVQSRTAFPHDIVDAEYSRTLNKIIMVGTYPSNALYVYDGATGTETSQALVKAPTAVSVAPDGLSAAVGHDALISIVDLASVGQPAAPAPVTVDVSATVFDVVLDGNGYVHAMPFGDQHQFIVLHSIHIATNTEQLGSILDANSHAKLLPSGTYLYASRSIGSPTDIEKWDISTGIGIRLYDSPYHGEFRTCDSVWLDESGTTIYTPCGNTFRSNPDPALDMIYNGKIALTATDFIEFEIEHLYQSDATNEIALVEKNPIACRSISEEPCATHLAIYDDEFLNLRSVHSIRPLYLDGVDYYQRGLFVFYDAVNFRKYLLSKLDGMPDPAAQFYISVIP